MEGGCVNGIKAARTFIVASQPTDGWIGREEVYELTLRLNAEITWKRSNKRPTARDAPRDTPVYLHLCFFLMGSRLRSTIARHPDLFCTLFITI